MGQRVWVGDGDSCSGDGVGIVFFKTVGMGTVTVGTVGDGDDRCPRAALLTRSSCYRNC